MANWMGCGDHIARAVEYALANGWKVELRKSQIIRATKGKHRVFMNFTPKCSRAWKNAIADMKRKEAGRVTSKL